MRTTSRNILTHFTFRWWWYLPLLLPVSIAFCLIIVWLFQEAAIQRRYEQVSGWGHPATLKELDEYYILPPEAEDHTNLWLAAFRLVEENTKELDSVQLPFLGEGPEPPLLDKAWPERQVAEHYLQECSEALLALQEAANAGGQARLEQDFSAGVNLEFRDADAARTAAKLLILEAHLRARTQDGDEMIDALRAAVSTGNALQHNPVLVPYLVRLRINGLFLDNIFLLSDYTNLPRAALVELQDELRKVKYAEDLHRAMIGERVMGLDFFGIINPDYGVIRTGILGLAAPGAKIKYIDIMNDVVQTTHQPLPDLMSAPPLSEKYDLNPRNPFNILTNSIVPILDEVFSKSASQLTRLRAVDAAIAVELYQRDHGELPATLEQLVPDYLPAVPIDSFSGEMLRYKPVDEGFIIYGLGMNLVDDNGAIEEENGALPLDEGIRWGGEIEEPQEEAADAEAIE